MIEYYDRMAGNYNADPAGCFWNDEPVAAAKHYVVEKHLAGWLRDGGTPPDENFDWSNCVELFLDAGLRSAGSYYHLPFMFNGQTYVGKEPTRLENPPEWHVKITPKEDGLRVIATFPLAPFGVGISKGNKLGAMFLANGAAWNGGQWHAPTGFQTLVLEMK